MMKRWICSRVPGRHRGQTLVMFALAIVLLVGFVALSIDVGYFLSERRAVQNAADAAAMAAGKYLTQQINPGAAAAKSQAISIANAYATLNGYQSGTDTTVEITPTANDVTVDITHDVPKFFLGVVYSGPWEVNAVAKARITREPIPYALIALGQSPSPGITFGGMSGGETVTTVQCDPPVTGCGSIGSNANITFNGNVSGEIDGILGAAGTITSIPNTFDYNMAAGGQGLIADPFLPITSPGSDVLPYCTVDAPPSGTDAEGNTVLYPGAYPNGYSFAANAKVVMMPGIYCFDKPLKVNSSGATLDASAGVLLYFRNGSTFNPGNANFILNSAKAAGLTWGADPGADPKWDKIAVWVDNTSGGSCSSLNNLDLLGGGNMDIQGAVYAPCSHVEIGGNAGNKTLGGVIIGNDINLHGNITLNLVTDTNYTASPPRVYLIR